LKLLLGTILSFFILALSWFSPTDTKNDIRPSEKVSEMLFKLGDKQPSHFLRFPSNKEIELGRQLFHEGFNAKRNGKKAKRLSKHFVCTSCHNVEKEQYDLSQNDAQKRLDYAVQNDIPFLQGSSMYGAINRVSFYNGDYFKKYGELVYPARKNLREAIQLCAIECAQGRRLKKWEIDAILAYLWSIGLRLEDLNLNEDELAMLSTALLDSNKSADAIALIKSRYMDHSPATFTKPPDNRNIGYAKKGKPNNGRKIYEQSCLHCHEDGRYSFFKLDNNENSFEFLDKHIDSYHRYSIYQVGRYGTPPMPGKKAYMPQYTQEKMSDQQMEDLRAYLRQESE